MQAASCISTFELPEFDEELGVLPQEGEDEDEDLEIELGESNLH